MICKTEAIVLKSMDFRETSRIATFFSRDFGKVKGVLKGIRKDSKKFGSQIDKFSVNDIVYYQYRNSDLHLVSQCDLRGYFFPIRKDLKRALAASYMLELVDILMPVEEKNVQIYEMMLNYLQSLETVKDVNQIVHIFQIKLLLLSGFRPYIDSCLKCQKKIHDKARFSLEDGGLICLDCPINEARVSFISKGAVASILYIEKNDWLRCLKLHLTEPIKKELKFILNNFLIFHLGRRVKSEKYLRV